ncbi:MerR family transcriptional regulator [Nocardia vaccinii]|uniref:MerR family transcriptional regulator n=1 Tax=Nocardia vaccinii TaxID=1822 RepID=UPI000832979D|nr:MerR family transcriptional regulator [Nocardia vaccinii]
MAIYIGEAATRSGLNVGTIRYYDSLGLLCHADRDSAGRRLFNDDAVRWLVFLRQMRATGMPLDRLRGYITHRESGADGVAGVLRVLGEHRNAMLTARAELDECLATVEAKIVKYTGLARTGQGPGAPQV